MWPTQFLAGISYHYDMSIRSSTPPTEHIFGTPTITETNDTELTTWCQLSVIRLQWTWLIVTQSPGLHSLQSNGSRTYVLLEFEKTQINAETTCIGCQTFGLPDMEPSALLLYGAKPSVQYQPTRRHIAVVQKVRHSTCRHWPDKLRKKSYHKKITVLFNCYSVHRRRRSHYYYYFLTPYPFPPTHFPTLPPSHLIFDHQEMFDKSISDDVFQLIPDTTSQFTLKEIDLA